MPKKDPKSTQKKAAEAAAAKHSVTRAGSQPGRPAKSETSDKADHPSAKESRTCTHFPVVAIGASAGGLEALFELFQNMPVDTGMAFVVVTHQHPGDASLLPELLGKETSMPVLEADNGLWDSADLRRLLQHILPQNTELSDYAVDAELPGIGRRHFVLNARCLQQSRGLPARILLAMEQVSAEHNNGVH